jgi:hypothetical protein
MSSVGMGPGGIPPLVSSTAGAAGQQRAANANQQSAEAAQRKFAMDQNALTAKAVGDVGAMDESGDRDADGRQPWMLQKRGPGQGGQPGQQTPKAPDPDGERGGRLDLEG